MSGDLVELELDKENWFIGQVEIIKSKYEITLFGSDWGRYVPQKKREHTPARWIASRPRFLPPFGEPFTKDNASPDFDDDYDDCLNNIDVDTLIFR
jgi:hypothetical protein